MARKPEEILRAIEGLPQDSLKEVKEFIDSLKKYKSKRPAAGRNGELLAKRQLCAIKKWAGRSLQAGFSGREHDAVLYGSDCA
ncbi:MAG: hypothetical protein A3G40_07115 [Deltaproteobacteria bacterium RIFCSPLOWO2_12_FULL_57_22]|nr:MAG: hypothetical protein A3G40_07115 [Deltaproteobacteria bacterium RIFCSPLOWO2_12_FULL_57_22]